MELLAPSDCDKKYVTIVLTTEVLRRRTGRRESPKL